MRAAIYLRQSEDRSGEEWGIERQRDEARRYVTARGWTVADEFKDNDISAYSGKQRPDFERMLKAVERGEIDVMVAKHMDRLLRRLKELESTLDRIGSKAFIVTTADGVDTSTEGGRLVARILCSVAQGEVERKGARQKAAAEQAAEQGRWTGGRRPFGYMSDGLTINQPEAAIVRMMYAKVILTESMHSIGKWLTSEGVKTTAGNKWTGTTVRQTLVKPRYAGLRTFHGDIKGRGLWEPIVDEDTWANAVAIMTTPGRQIAPTGRKHLLSGLMLCAKCQKPVGTGHTSGPIYKCKNDGCGGVSRQMIPINALAEKLLIGFMGTPEAQELLVDRNRPDVAVLRERERIINEKIDQLAIDNANDLLSARQVKVATDHLEAELKQISKTLRSGVRSKAVEEMVNSDDPAKTWEGYTLDRRRTVISEVVEFTLRPSGRGMIFQPEHLGYRWLVAEE